MVEKTVESPLDHNEIKPVNPKVNQPWIFIGKTDAEAEAPILWPPDSKSRLTEKDSDAGKGWRHKEKGMTEGEMVALHHWLDGHEFEQALGVGDGQGSLHAAIHRVTKSWTQLSNWTEMNNAVNKTSKLIGIYRTTHPTTAIFIYWINDVQNNYTEKSQNIAEWNIRL